MIHFEILFFNYFKIFFSGENHFIRTSCNYPSGAHDFVCSLHSFFHPPISGQLINKAVCKHAYTKMLLTFATISGWLFPLFARFSTHFPCPSAFLYAMRHLLSAGFFMIIISLAPPVFFPRLFVVACAGGVMWWFLHPSWRNFHLPLVLLPYFFFSSWVLCADVLCCVIIDTQVKQITKQISANGHFGNGRHGTKVTANGKIQPTKCSL